MIDIKEHIVKDYMKCMYCRTKSSKLYDIIFASSNFSNTTLFLCENCLLELKNKIENILVVSSNKTKKREVPRICLHCDYYGDNGCDYHSCRVSSDSTCEHWTNDIF